MLEYDIVCLERGAARGREKHDDDGSAACPPDRRVQPGETEIRTAVLAIGPEDTMGSRRRFCVLGTAKLPHAIAAEFNRRGIPKARGCKWSAAQVRDVVIRLSR